MPSPVCFLEREGKALYGITSVFCRDITDQLLDQNGLSYTGTSKQSDFTSLGIGRQKINYLDSCLQNLYHRALLFKCRRFSVNTPPFTVCNRFSVINGFSQNIK